MDQLHRLDELPTVDEALRLPYNQYKQYAQEVLKYSEFCLLGFGLPEKVDQWCTHLNCTQTIEQCSIPNSQFTTTQSIPGTTTSAVPSAFQFDSHANDSLWKFLLSVAYNGTRCYDDYMCDEPSLSHANHYVLGYTCLVLCLFGIVSNLVLLPAYNLGSNGCGATVYLSAMAVFDIVYLLLTLLVVVYHYIHGNFVEQVKAYAQFSARFIPIGTSVMQFCEVVVVWMVVALLANRLLYMKFGFQSKLLCSQMQSLKSVSAVIVFILAYCACKIVEYTHERFSEMNVVRVVLTFYGKNELYRNLMYHWLKVPIQMFLPYLTVGVLISVVVRKMLKFHKSKWKAVASLCNDTACACVCRSGVCGTACKEGALENASEKRSNQQNSSTASADVITQQPLLSSTTEQIAAKLAQGTGDPIEQELEYLFFQLPQVDETREYANVVTAVCIGLLLLLLKVPKFILHVLSTENYISYNPGVFILIDQFLDIVFASCKPFVCILVGAHFREVLLTPRKCCQQDTTITVDPQDRCEIELTGDYVAA